MGHRLATTDAVIYATAHQRGAEFLTCDAHFKGLAGVTLIASRPAETRHNRDRRCS
ncbi:MAG: PIN domain-containing protein [Niveispirillum sp.]|uniref:PIN domain-containing protein n=1 Tax=Niveispirillum sp. TaxID=1917217 RepID=UPI00403619B1